MYRRIRCLQAPPTRRAGSGHAHNGFEGTARHKRGLARGAIWDQRGVTLVESLVASAIVALVLLSLVEALSMGSIGMHTASERVTAEILARSQLEYVKQQSYVSAPTSYDTVELPTGGYSIAAEAASVPGADSNIQKITVRIYHHEEEILVREGYKVNR